MSSAIAGACVGYKLGGDSGKFVAGPKGAEVGKKAGITIGFTVGGGFGFYFYINKTEKTETYIQWISEIKDLVLNEEFKSQHENDEVLKDYKCPITQDFMIMPARLQTGHLFDMVALEEIKPDEKGRIPCPLTRELIDLSSITLDRERGLLIHKRIGHLIDIDIQNAQGKPHILKCLQYRKDRNKEIIKDFHEKIFKIINKRRSDGITTFEEFQKEQADFVKIFGDTPSSEIDWSLDWKDILSKRWVHFYPHIPMFNSNEV